MRIDDLLGQHLDGVRSVVAAPGGSFDVGRGLQLPTGIRLAEASGSYSAGDLVVVDDVPAGPAHAVGPVLPQCGVGARLLILCRAGAGEFDYGELLDVLVAAGCQVRQVAPIDTRAVRTGLVVERVAAVRPPLDYLGRVVPGADDRSLLRVVNEHALGGYVARAVRAQLRRREDEAEVERARGGADALRQRLADAQRQHGELTTRLRGTEEQLRRTQRRLQMVEGSTSLRVGQALVAAVKEPRRVPRVSRQLLATWRRRPAGPGTAAGGGPPPDDAAEHRRHFLTGIALSAGSRDRPVIAGILRADTAAALAPDCAVTVLTPHDADLLVEAISPDLVLIEAAAGRPGETWAYLGTPYAVDRDRALLAAMAGARATGAPVVLWWNVPYAEAPGLRRLAEQCDVVVAGENGPPDRPPWSRGVQLSVHNPLGAGNRQSEPLRLGEPGWVPGEWRRTADRYRAASVVVPVAASTGAGLAVRDDLLESLACGARVVLSDFSGLPAALADAVVLDAAEPAVTLEPAALRRLLRELFTGYSTQARLRRLAELADVSVPCAAGWAFSVIARLEGPRDLAALVADVDGQRHRPVEVVIACDDVAAGAEGELADGGMVLRQLPAAAPDVALLDAATGEWLAPWSPAGSAGSPVRWRDTHLLDLAVAAAVSGAEAVGFTPGGDRFTTALRLPDAAVRRSAARHWGLPGDGRLDGWWRRGGRLFTLDSDVTA